jgi:hypothetical protein
MPKNIPYGTVPNSAFASNDTPFLGLKIGIITRVDEHHLKADVRVITGGDERFEIDLTQAMAGPRSFLGGIPEVNSVVIVGYRRRSKQIYDAMILGYLPVGNLLGLRFDPLSPIPPEEIEPADANEVKKIFGGTVRYKRIKGRQGDIFGMSSAGAEFQLSKDARLANRAGDSLELRDSDRTLLTQAIHRVDSDSAAYAFSGAVRRAQMNLPVTAFKEDGTLKSPAERYYGRDELQAAGIPPTTFSNATGTVLDRINDENEFPTVTYSSNRQAFYASDSPAMNFEDVLNGASGRAFTERRVEIRHDSDLGQEVLDEIDGFAIDRPRAYIEHVFGTVVGNDAFSTLGQRQYARVLKPKIFEDFAQTAPPGGFRLEECLRPPGVSADEALTMAGAYLFRMLPPRSGSKSQYAVSVSKQGKLFVNLPGSQFENYPSKNISAEINAEGAIKMRLGAATPDRVSLHLTLEGGLVLDVGADAAGNCITTNFRGAIKNVFKGNNNSNDVAHSEDIQGNTEKSVSGNDIQVVKGLYQKTVDGGYNVQASSVKVNGLNGYTGNYGSYNATVSGKTQSMHAQLVQETIATGGKQSTILAGGLTQSILAGAMSTTVTAGATSFSNPAGAFSVSVGTGAISLTTTAGAVTLSTTAGAMSISAATGAVSLTSGLAINLTAVVKISLTAAMIELGGVAAVLGVVRGLTSLPPGTPTLDYVTGLPLLGSALVRSV